MPKLPRYFPDGSKYVVEACGAFVRRYVELPNGQKINLRPRKAHPYDCAEHSTNTVPDQNMTSDLTFDRRVFA